MEENNSEQKVKEQEKKEEAAKENKPRGLSDFYSRAVASLFDLTALCFVYFVLDFLIFKHIFEQSVFTLCFNLLSLKSYYLGVVFTQIIISSFLYSVILIANSFFESSKISAGIGKRIVGIYVLDEHLKPIDRKKAAKRNLLKFVSLTVLGLGFVFYFFNNKKQALHDVIAKTVVVNKKDSDININTIIFSICFILTLVFIFVSPRLLLEYKKEELSLPKRAVEVIPAAKGFLQEADTLTNLNDSLVVYDPLRESLEVYLSTGKFSEEQKNELINKYSDKSPDFVNFKAILKLKSESIKCSNDGIESIDYFIQNEFVDISDNQPEVTEIKCELFNDSHFYAKFFRKKLESAKQKTWDLQVSSKLKIRREQAKLKYDSEKSETSVAIWHHDNGQNIVEVGYYNKELSSEDLANIRLSKGFINNRPELIVTFDLQQSSDSLNVATVTKYGVTFLKSKNLFFPGREDKVDFFYVPSVTETLQLAKLSGRLAEGERVTGYLNHLAKKLISEVDFEVEWDLSFNVPLIDLEKKVIDHVQIDESQTKGTQNTDRYCDVKADQTAFSGVDIVALYYPEEGDVAVGIFGDALSDTEKEEFKKRKSIWSNVNGKIASFVIFFDFKRDSQSFSRETLLEYTVHFVRDNLGRLYFLGDSDRVQFNFKDIDFTAEDLISLSGDINTEISFNLNKKKESKFSGLQFSWNCKMRTKILKIQ